MLPDVECGLLCIRQVTCKALAGHVDRQVDPWQAADVSRLGNEGTLLQPAVPVQHTGERLL